MSSAKAIDGIDPQALPSGQGCVECLAGDGPGWWVRLRRCAQCGHIGCCDSSIAPHSTAHAEQSGQPIIASFEPGESWFWNFTTSSYLDGPELATPRWRDGTEAGPGPVGQVPDDWQDQVDKAHPA